MIQVALGILLAIAVLWSLPVLSTIALLMAVPIFKMLGVLIIVAAVLGAAKIGFEIINENKKMRDLRSQLTTPNWPPEHRPPKPINPSGRIAELRRKHGLPDPDASVRSVFEPPPDRMPK